MPLSRGASHSPATTTRSNRGFELSPRVRLSKTVMRKPARRYSACTVNETANRSVQPLDAQTGWYAPHGLCDRLGRPNRRLTDLPFEASRMMT